MRTHSTVEFVLETVLNMVGFLVGLIIGVISMIGFRNTGSPNLLRLTIAFFAISLGFLIIWTGHLALELAGDVNTEWIHILGMAAQTTGYLFIAFAHSIKAFLPKPGYLRSVGIMPLFLISTVQIEHIFRSVSFILLVYGAIETIMSYIETRKRGTISVAAGLALLALGEFLGWYSFVFPESILYTASVSIKIAGLLALFIPVSKIPLTLMRIDEVTEEQDSDEDEDEDENIQTFDLADDADSINKDTRDNQDSSMSR